MTSKSIWKAGTDQKRPSLQKQLSLHAFVAPTRKECLRSDLQVVDLRRRLRVARTLCRARQVRLVHLRRAVLVRGLSIGLYR